MAIFQYYRTVKKLRIQDRRLALLKVVLFTGVLVFVVIFELWLWGGAYQASPVVGAISFTVRHPTVDNCDPNADAACFNAFQPLTELAYCQQAENMSLSYKGNILPCVIYDASSAQIISDKSVAITTSASTSREQLVCNSTTDVLCPRIYNQTTTQEPFYTAETEAFTISFDHTVSSADECTVRNSDDYYACSCESSRYQGRLQSGDAGLCQREYANGRAFADARGDVQTGSAPCYIVTNTTQAGDDVFALETIIAASGFQLDACNPLESNGSTTEDATTPCHTYRQTGATILMNIFWNDFERYKGIVAPFYYYQPQLLAGSPFQTYIPYFESYRSSRTLLDAHGVRLLVVIGGSFHSLSALPFIITLFTAFGMLKITKLILDKVMTTCLPERKQYRRAKFEPFELSTDDLEEGEKVALVCDDSEQCDIDGTGKPSDGEDELAETWRSDSLSRQGREASMVS